MLSELDIDLDISYFRIQSYRLAQRRIHQCSTTCPLWNGISMFVRQVEVPRERDANYAVRHYGRSKSLRPTATLLS